ncbi:MAG: flavin reductase [Eubacterium sp.]|nr:flavin reductase [Eubacterium sp.]
MPPAFEGRDLYGFDWKENALSIPSPIAVVTSYKDNGKTNATMQSWMAFTSSGENFYCIFGSVNKYCHMYKTLKESKAAVINFPSADNFLACYSTIQHNEYDTDEIAAAGLTAEKASCVNAPRIKECFLNLECEYVWEKEFSPDGFCVAMCVKVVNVVMDEEYFSAQKKFGELGYLYNIHSPTNPESGEITETCVGVINKLTTYGELEEKYGK